MKEKVKARNLWIGIYPILFFQGTAIVIQNILMITLSVMSANSKYTGISQYSDRVNKINLHAMEITLLTDIICIIINNRMQKIVLQKYNVKRYIK